MFEISKQNLLFQQQLASTRQLQVIIKKNGALVNSNILYRDIDVQSAIYAQQIIRFKVEIIDSSTNPKYNFCAKIDSKIHQLKGKFAQQIGMHHNNQIWMIEDRVLSTETLESLAKQYGEEQLYFLVESKRSLQFYGFTLLKDITLNQFKRFSLEDQQYFRQQLAKKEKVQFPMKEYEDIFRELCLHFIFPMIKKNCPISHALAIIKDIAQPFLNNQTLWVPSEDNNKSITFNDTYIIYNLINSAEKKLKIELLRKLKINYPVPFILMRQNQQVKLFEEHFWIHNEAFNIASMTYGTQKVNGKSLLLNQFFNTNFISRSESHQKCSKNVQISYNILKSTEFNVNIIDVCNQIGAYDKEWIMKSSNFLIFHHKFSNQQLSLQQKKQQCTKIRKQIDQYLTKRKISKVFLLIFRDSNTNEILNEHGDISLKQISKQIINKQTAKLKMITKHIYQLLKKNYAKQKSNFWCFSDNLCQNQNSLVKIHPIFRQLQFSQSKISNIIEIQQRNYCRTIQEKSWVKIIEGKNADKQKAKALGLSQIIKDCIFICSTIPQYTNQIIKKFKDFLVFKKNNISEKFKNIQVILQSNSIDTNLEKITQLFDSIIKSSLIIASKDVKDKFQSTFNKIIQKQNKSFAQLSNIFFDEITPKIFSIQLLWRELIYLNAFVPDYTFERTRPFELQKCLMHLGKSIIAESQTFQLIDGDLLNIPKKFLHHFFEIYNNKNVMVIGIVGRQSSGKSTLLNTVFGCDFMSSVGRCTKGVYGTYYQITNKQKITYDGLFILDTEGLMSAYENKKVKNRQSFDQKLLLFCSQICDLLIFNNNGDLTKQSFPLIQSMFDEENTDINYLPEIIFVINMNMDENKNQQRQTKQFIERIMSQNPIAKKGLENKQIRTMSLAFEEKKRSSISQSQYFKKNNILKIDYAKKATQLSHLIQKILVERRSKKVRKMGNFLLTLTQRWETIKQYPILTRHASKKEKIFYTQIENWKQKLESQFAERVDKQKEAYNRRKQQQCKNLTKQKIIEWMIQQEKKETEFIDKFYQQRLAKFKEQIRNTLKVVDQEALAARQAEEKQYYKVKFQLVRLFFQQQKMSLNYNNAINSYQKQFNELIHNIPSNLTKQAIQKQKGSFDKYYKQKTESFQKQINWQRFSRDLYQRYLGIYKLQLNALKSTKQHYDINNRYAQQIDFSESVNPESYKNKISKILLSTFSSYEMLLENKDMPPLNRFHKSSTSSKFQYFDMEKFYTISKKYRYATFVSESKSINIDYFYDEMHGHLARSNQVSTITQALKQDFISLGLRIKYFKLKDFIIRSIMHEYYRPQNIDKYFLSQDDIEYVELDNQIRHQYRVSNRENLQVIQFRKKNLFEYNMQFLLMSKQFINKKLKSSSISQQSQTQYQYIQSFCKSKNNFNKRFQLITSNFLQENQKVFIDQRKSKLKRKNIANKLISLFFKNKLLDNSSGREIFDLLQKSEQTIRQRLEGDLKKINLKLPENLNIQNVYFLKRNREILNFKQNHVFQGIINTFSQLWNRQSLKYRLKQQKEKQSFCSIETEEFILAKKYQQNQALLAYKDKFSENIKVLLNSPQLLRLIFQHFRQQKVIQNILTKIKNFIDKNRIFQRIQLQSRIQSVVYYVSGIIDDFNKDLRQICQILIYGFQTELHSWAFHYFWKKRQQIILEQFKKKSNIKTKQQEYQIFDKHMSGQKELGNAIYFADCYKANLSINLEQLISQKKTIILNKHKKKMRYGQIEWLKDRINNQLIERAKNWSSLAHEERKKLENDIVNFYIRKKMRMINKSYENQYLVPLQNEFQIAIAESLYSKRAILQEFQRYTRIFAEEVKDKKQWRQNPNLKSQILQNKNKGKLPKLVCKFNSKNLKQIMSTLNIKNYLQFSHHLNIKIGQITLDHLLTTESKELILERFREEITLNICKEKCPCCKNLCDVNMYKNPNHSKHQCSYGHNIRVFGGIFLKTYRSYIPSFNRCHEMSNSDLFQFQGNTISWRQFMRQHQNWQFSSQNLIDEILSLQNQKLLWQASSVQICRVYKQPQISISLQEIQTLRNEVEISYIFVLDQSGSMIGSKWDQLKLQVDKQLRNIQRAHPHSTYSILKFNQTVTPFVIDEDISNIQLRGLNMVGGNTDYSPAFKKVYELSREHKQLHRAVIFLTDGIANYPRKEVALLKDLKAIKKSQNRELLLRNLI